MEFNSEPVTSPVRDAATVVLLRDGEAGLEVFLVKRHGLSDVLGGAYVFPGGKLDAADHNVATEVSAHELHARLAEAELSEAAAAALFVAAAREAFEECGVRLPIAALLPWVRWITPVVPTVSSKRFDTRFFVAAMPADQEARHDDVETTHSQWLSPRAALEQYRTREIELAPPQIMSLAHLSRHGSVASVMTEAHSKTPPVVLPEAFEEDGERVICYPGDSRHSVPTRALPGPSRLLIRNRHFEAPGGFESLFL